MQMAPRINSHALARNDPVRPAPRKLARLAHDAASAVHLHAAQDILGPGTVVDMHLASAAFLVLCKSKVPMLAVRQRTCVPSPAAPSRR